MKYPKWYLRFVGTRSGFLAIWTVLSPFCLALILALAIKKAAQAFWRELIGNSKEFYRVWVESLASKSKVKDESDPEFWNAV